MGEIHDLAIWFHSNGFFVWLGGAIYLAMICSLFSDVLTWIRSFKK